MTEVLFWNPVPWEYDISGFWIPEAWEYENGLILEPCGLGTCLRFDGGNLWAGNMTEVCFWKPVYWEHD